MTETIVLHCPQSILPSHPFVSMGLVSSSSKKLITQCRISLTGVSCLQVVFFFLLPLLTCYQRYSGENVRQFSIISVRNISSLRCQHNSFKLSTGKKIQVSLKEKSILVLIIRHTHMCGHTHKQFFFQICHCFHHLHSYLSLE